MISFKRYLAKNYVNLRGWRTRRKILVIESDDWGSIRMPSRAAYNKLLSKKIFVDRSYFDKNDSVESAEDLVSLFEVLNDFKDINGSPAVITAFTVAVNPNFENIESSNKKEYHWELITETYKRRPHTKNTINVFHEGIKKRMFYPQFHGREHINVMRWMEAINSPSTKEKLAFKEHAIISATMLNDVNPYPLNYFAAFDYFNKKEINSQKEIVEDGLSKFEDIFGFKSMSFVAPCSIWGDGINETLCANEVKLLSGQQNHPTGDGRLKVINRYWGSKNNCEMVHWRRNCTFEPSRNHDYDWVDHCMKEIDIAFRWGKPAVINSHRVNYIGSIFPENRERTLRMLRTLLHSIQQKWSQVEFLDTERLGHIMVNSLSS